MIKPHKSGFLRWSAFFSQCLAGSRRELFRYSKPAGCQLFIYMRIMPQLLTNCRKLTISEVQQSFLCPARLPPLVRRQVPPPAGGPAVRPGGGGAPAGVEGGETAAPVEGRLFNHGGVRRSSRGRDRGGMGLRGLGIRRKAPIANPRRARKSREARGVSIYFIDK